MLLIPLGSLSHGAIAHASRTRGLSRCAHSAPRPAFAQRALSDLPLPRDGHRYFRASSRLHPRLRVRRRRGCCQSLGGPPPEGKPRMETVSISLLPGSGKRIPIKRTVGAAFSGVVTKQAALSQPHSLSPPASPGEGNTLPLGSFTPRMDEASFFP